MKKKRKYEYEYILEPGTIEKTIVVRPPSPEAVRVHSAVMRRYIEQLRRKRES